MITMGRAEFAVVNAERDHTAQDLLDRGAAGPVNAIGVSIKGLVKKGLVEMTQAPRARGNRKARYKLTMEGITKVRRQL